MREELTVIIMKQLINKNDKYKMNWIEGTAEWGTVKAPETIEVSKHSDENGDTVTERYTFTNISDKDVFTSLTDISIYTPFNDDYLCGAKACMTSRCHAHIWCGGNISYVMCLRMGGEAPHLGLVLTEGSIGGYSVERDLSKISNDRGDIILHPSPAALAPGESFTVSWTLFWHNGPEDFYKKLSEYNKRFIYVSAENYVVFRGEDIKLKITPSFEFSSVTVTVNGRAISPVSDGKTVKISEKAETDGEYSYIINAGGVTTHCNILVLPPLSELAEKRCRFIAENQQYDNKSSRLDGAYLIYDNEEKHIHYSRDYDRNGGRERVGMGILIAKYLREHRDAFLEESLKKYIKYVERELLCTETGEVFNDYMRDNSFKRLYNYPWVSLLYLELYKLYGERALAEISYKIMKSFYSQGGAHFYAIEVPAAMLCEALEECGMGAELDDIKAHFREHADFIAETGFDYPAHEVNYEQSIAAPAANLLFQVYDVTGEAKYLDAAKKQLKVLELFNGRQPDYHLYETAIRHWDGYWFGKRRLYGDTFPHYWSALTGNAYNEYANAENSAEYKKRAESSYRSALSLINADGTASCAYVYPAAVNGERAAFADPYANDQDWALYFMLRFKGI